MSVKKSETPSDLGAETDLNAKFERGKSLKDAAQEIEAEAVKPSKRGPGRPPLTEEEKAARKPKRTRKKKETPIETFTPIEPEQVAQVLAVMSTVICSRIGVSPLTEEECESGGEAIAPIMDLYFPGFATKVGPWGALLYWGFAVTLPRYNEYQEIRAESAPPPPEATDGVHPSSEWHDDRPPHLRGPVV